MKKLLLLLFTISTLFGNEEGGNYFVDNFLKYSTFYMSVSLESPFAPKQKFSVNTGEGTFQEITEEIKDSYNLSFGIIATLGAVSGWEYQFKWSSIRSFGEEFVDSESWIRYLGDNFVVKGSYVNFGREDLEFGQLDARWRKSVGNNWNFTVGGNFRGHPAYGLFPFDGWLEENQGQWWNLAYEYGYTDEFYYNYYFADYYWYDADGNLVSESDADFYENYYGDLIHQYNEEQVDALGWQYEASVVIGVDYYLYNKKYWVHGWLSVMPYSEGLDEYSFKYEKGDVDFDIGLVAGLKLNRNFGIFSEGRYLSYWGIDSYEIKAGINYTIF